MKKSVIILILFGISLICINFVSAWADNGSLIQNVDGCNQINTTDATYILTQAVNSTGTCFNITAQNITLDCQNNIINYSINGTASTYGIFSNKNFTKIMNCNISDGNWTSPNSDRYGILFNITTNSTIFNNYVLTSNSTAIYLNKTNFTNITSNTATSNQSIAFYLLNSFNNDLAWNTGISNPLKIPLTIYLRGFYTQFSPNNNFVSNTGKGWGYDALGGNSDGIFIESSSNCTLINNTGISTREGIILYSSSNCTLINNTGTAETGVGIWLFMSSNNTLINNTGTSNRSTSVGTILSYGIYIGWNSDNNVLTSDTGISNVGRGVMIDTASGTVLTNITAISYNSTSVTRSAIYFYEANYTNITDCANVSGIASDVYFYSGANSVGNIFTNCSYNTSKEYVNGAGNYLTRKWYYQAYVNYSNGSAAVGANITGYNASNIIQFTENTSATGWIEKKEVIDYINTGGTRAYYSNYTINASKGETNNATSIFNLTIQGNSINNYFTLEGIMPSTSPPVHSSSSNGNPVFRPNEIESNKGYTVVLLKNWKVSFNVKHDSHEFNVEDITPTGAKISIYSEKQEATLSIGEEKKFEISGDNYYDVLVKLNSIDTKLSSIPKANITIQTINEEIPSKNKEPVNENAAEEIVNNNNNDNTNNETPVNNKSNIIYYIIGGIIVILGIIIFASRKVKRNKRYYEFGY